MSTRLPTGIVALVAFFFGGAAISFVSSVAMVFPGPALDLLWRINPAARAGFTSMGRWAVLLLATVCLACTAAGVGLWRRARWGHRLAVAILMVNLLGDLLSGILGPDPRSLIGVPIAAAVTAWLLTAKVRFVFSDGRGA